MYNDFLVVAHRNCGGNILLVISGVETEGDSLANTAFVDSLVWEGAQNAMGELNTQGRLLTWKGTPSSAHKEQILKALQGQLSPLELPESVIEYANVTNGDKGGGFICNIL
uniref:Uncharacterized protein n=3 Tax=Phaeomonas parva TaxID=124430 RepID=A0A7S1TY39_9STRA|mmetsp:Transcript_23110/g.71990  ORF Transcript_23110/g.71990 Transcript_23110/m.71990 type:complete len:111 (+) Transcript_23110:287-619(+)